MQFTTATEQAQRGRATRGTVMVILAVLWGLFGLGYAAWALLAFAGQAESFLRTSADARYTALWTGGTWSAALVAAALAVLRGKAWGAPAALWLCGWIVVCLVAQGAALLAASGATASALVATGIGLLLLALVHRWCVWLFGRAVLDPQWLAVAGLVWTGWVWVSLLLPVLDPAANQPAAGAPAAVSLLGLGEAAALGLAAYLVARGALRGTLVAVCSLAASAVGLTYAIASGSLSILEPLTFAALGAHGTLKVGGALEPLAIHYPAASAAVVLGAQMVTAIALLCAHRKSTKPQASGQSSRAQPLQSTEAGAVGTPRRFGIGTLLAVTAAFGVLMGLLRAAGIPEVAAGGITAFVAAVGAGQALLFGGRVPRAGSMTIGALFYVAAAIVITHQTEPDAVPALFDYVPWLFVGGGILGYLTGTVVGGFFMLLQGCAMHRKPRAATCPVVVADGKPRRRWLRLPVRWSTLVLLSLIPLGLWLGLEVHPLRQQSRAAAALKRLGAYVEARNELPVPWRDEPYLVDVDGVYWNDRGVTDADARLLRSLSSLTYLNLDRTGITDATLSNLRHMRQLSSLELANTNINGAGLAALDQIQSLEGLDLSGTSVCDDDLRYLRRMTALAGLSLDRTRVTGTGLAHLQPVPSLQHVSLSGAPVTAAGIEEIARLQQVTFLALHHCHIGRNGLSHLGRMKRLRRLELADATIADEDLSQVTGFKSLRELTLRGSSVEDSGLEFVSGLSSLQLLDLAGASLTDAAMTHLSGLSSLVFLDLSQTSTTDEGMIPLAGLSSLERLYLTNVNLTDEGMQHLKGLSALNGLGLAGTRISDDGLVALKGLTNLAWLDLSHTKVSDKGLKHLDGLAKLQWLDLDGTSVTDAGVWALQGATPQHINIEWTHDRERAEQGGVPALEKRAPGKPGG